MAAARPVHGRWELLVGGEPVTDRRLEAVVELEHVEGPVRRAGEVGPQVRLGDTVEVVVPGAPAHLVRRRRASATGRAQRAGPGLEQRGRIAIAVGDHDLVQLAPLARLEHGATEERLDPELDAVRAVARRPHAGRCRRAPIRRGTRRPAGRRCRRGGPSPARSAARRPRRAPSRRGACRSAATARPPIGSGPGRSRNVATPVGDHDWYPCRSMRTGSTTGSRRATTATASTATGSSARFATDHVNRSPLRDHSTSTASGSAARTSTRASTRRIPGR